MPAIKKERNTEMAYGKGIVSNTVKDYSNDSFVVKKAEEAKAFLQKNGFPGQVKNNS
jgi:hypothetical protein